MLTKRMQRKLLYGVHAVFFSCVFSITRSWHWWPINRHLSDASKLVSDNSFLAMIQDALQEVIDIAH
jgi:hypothetical protein